MKGTLITANDLTEEALRKLREVFDSDQNIINLRNKQSIAIKRHKFTEAMAYGKAIEDLFDQVVEGYVNQCNKEAQSFDLLSLGLPNEDILDIEQNYIVLYMCCDIIDTAIRNIDDDLAKTDDTLKFEMFSDIESLFKGVQLKLEVLAKTTQYLKNMIFADISDNMYGMMKNKAKSIISKNLKNNGNKTN